jgi:hypothetical protein
VPVRVKLGIHQETPFMPKGKHLPGATAKENRQYEHILESTGSKRIAAATVNKLKTRGKKLRGS